MIATPRPNTRNLLHCAHLPPPLPKIFFRLQHRGNSAESASGGSTQNAPDCNELVAAPNGIAIPFSAILIAHRSSLTRNPLTARTNSLTILYSTLMFSHLHIEINLLAGVVRVEHRTPFRSCPVSPMRHPL